MKIPIVFSTDHNFIIPTGVAITSLLSNSNVSNYEIIILISPNVTDLDKGSLTNLVINTKSVISFIEVGMRFKNAFETRGITVATYYRLVIPWLLPGFDKILYCDGDIIFRGDLSELYNTDIKNYLIGGVKDTYDSTSFKNHLTRIGLKQDEYINAGVLLINSKLWREENLLGQIQPHLSIKYEYQDQDIINLICLNRIKYLSPIFNFNVGTYPKLSTNKEFDYPNGLTEFLKDIKILHFCGGKPWKEQLTYFCFEWFFAYSRTQWYQPEKELALYDSIIRQKLPPYRRLINFLTKILGKSFLSTLIKIKTGLYKWIR